MTNYEKLKLPGESIDDVISRLLWSKETCRHYCAVPVKRFIHCQGHRCSDRIRIFLESEVIK
jgi:hypothetical protein